MIDKAILDVEIRGIDDIYQEIDDLNTKLDSTFNAEKYDVGSRLVESFQSMRVLMGEINRQFEALVKVTQQEMQTLDKMITASKQLNDDPSTAGVTSRKPKSQQEERSFYDRVWGGRNEVQKAQTINQGLQGAWNMYGEGFSGASIAGFGSNVAYGLGALAGSGPLLVLGKSLEILSDALREEDRFDQRAYELWREAGGDARGKFREMTASPWESDMIKYGFTSGMLADLMQAEARATGRTSGAKQLMAFQSHYGLAQEGIGLLGAVAQGGGNAGNVAAIMGHAIGAAMNQKLEQGRWGEMFSSLSKAAAAIVTRDVDISELRMRQEFIGSIGARYRGDTPSAQMMSGTLQQLASGQGTGLNRVMALQAAGFGSGTGFFEAEYNLGVGGVDLEKATLENYANHPIIASAWASGDRNQKALALRVLFPNLTPQQKVMMMDALDAYFREDKPARFRKHSDRDAAVDFDKRTTGRKLAPEIRPQRNRARGDTRHGTLFDSGVGDDFSDVNTDDAARSQRWELMMDAYEGMPEGELKEQFRERMIRHYGMDPNRHGQSGALGEFGSIDEFEQKYSMGHDNHEYGRDRTHWPNSKTGKFEKLDKPRPHLARDIPVPPGTAIYSPVDGVVRENGRIQGGEMGWFVGVQASSGEYYRFLHLTDRSGKPVGSKVRKGELLGHTFNKEKFSGGSKSHLHLEGYKSIEAYRNYRKNPTATEGVMDPLEGDGALGVEGLNTMLGGVKPPRGTKASAAAAGNALVEERMRVDIYVHDNRTRVTKSATRHIANTPAYPSYRGNQR